MVRGGTRGCLRCEVWDVRVCEKDREGLLLCLDMLEWYTNWKVDNMTFFALLLLRFGSVFMYILFFNLFLSAGLPRIVHQYSNLAFDD